MIKDLLSTVLGFFGDPIHNIIFFCIIGFLIVLTYYDFFQNHIVYMHDEDGDLRKVDLVVNENRRYNLRSYDKNKIK